MLQRKEHVLHPGRAPPSSVSLQFLTGFSFSLPSQCLFPNPTEDGIQSDLFPPFRRGVVKAQTGNPTQEPLSSLGYPGMVLAQENMDAGWGRKGALGTHTELLLLFTLSSYFHLCCSHQEKPTSAETRAKEPPAMPES